MAEQEKSGSIGQTTAYRDGRAVITRYEQHIEGDSLRLMLAAPEGDRALLPDGRRHRVYLYGVASPGEVALLVAQGKSNPEIAAELFITVRTVKSHITNILTKVDLSSRSQLAVWVVETGLQHHPGAGSG